MPAAAARIKARFAHVDAAGILFFPRYSELVSTAYPGLAVGGARTRLVQDFLSPLRLGEDLDLRLRQRTAGSFKVTGDVDGRPCIQMRATRLTPAAKLPRLPARPAFIAPARRVLAWEVGRDGRMQLSRYLERINATIEEWFESTLKLPFADLVHQRGEGTPTVRLDMRCLAMPPEGAALEHRLQIVHLGNSSLRVRLWACAADAALVVTDQTLVHIRHKNGAIKSAPWPPALRATFERDQ